MLQSSFERRIPRGIEVLLHVTKSAETRPYLAHRRHIEWIECPKGSNVEIQRAAVAADRAIESLISQENGAGDDSSAILKENDRPGFGVEPGGWIAISAVAGG